MTLWDIEASIDGLLARLSLLQCHNSSIGQILVKFVHNDLLMGLHRNCSQGYGHICNFTGAFSIFT